MGKTKVLGPGKESYTTNVYRKKQHKGALSKAQSAQVRTIIDSKNDSIMEKKKFDLVLNFNINNTFANTQTYDLTNPAQGSGSSEREGDHLRQLNLFLRFQLAIPDNTNRIRVIVWQRGLNSATISPSLVDILQYTNTVQIDRDIYSPYITHSEYVGFFKILFDRNYEMVGGTNTGQLCEEMYFDLSKHKMIHFNESGVTGENHYFISVVSDNLATPPTLKGYTRMRYYDN